MEDIIKQIGQYGPIGLVAAYLLWDRSKLTTRMDEIQESRIKEGRETIQALHAGADAINNLATEIRRGRDQ